MAEDFQSDIAGVGRIPAVPPILDVVCRTTGNRRGGAGHRKPLDRLQRQGRHAFGSQPGGELKIETTICNEIREHREPVVSENVAEDEGYCCHHTPAMYGFQSYISRPVLLPDGALFGRCARSPPSLAAEHARRSSACSSCSPS